MIRAIIIAGRGPTVKEMPSGIPIMAVSSGVFASPYKPKHFCTIDSPKYFTNKVRVDGGWADDPLCRWWNVLHDPVICKHVPSRGYGHGWEKRARDIGRRRVSIEDVMLLLGDKRPDLLGWQPGWQDFPNVTSYHYSRRRPVNFTEQGWLGADDAPTQKSVLFAVQVAARLGYNLMIFAGVDLCDDTMAAMYDSLKQWYPVARRRGIEWQCVSFRSRLAEFMPVTQKEAAA